MVISARRSYSFQRSTALLSLLQTLDNYLALPLALEDPKGVLADPVMGSWGIFGGDRMAGLNTVRFPAFSFPACREGVIVCCLPGDSIQRSFAGEAIQYGALPSRLL